MRFVLLFSTLLLIIGCDGNRSVKTSDTDNSEIKVETLFTDPDGYTVKRFRDKGQWRYYVVPGPAKAVSVTVHQTGKYTTVLSDEIQTVK